MSVHPPGSVKLLQIPEVTWLGTVMLVDGVNEKETKEIIENKKKRQKGKALLFLMLIKSETKKRCKGKASNRIQLSGSKEVKGALFLLRYHLFRGFEMFLNSRHSRVINWK